MVLVALAGSVLAAASSSLHWLTRPHIFTILLTAVWTSELEKMRIGIRKSWLIFPGLMLLWVNLHGAFLAGLMIWGMYFGGLLIDRNFPWERIKAFLWSGLGSLLVTLVNPDGIDIWETGLDFLGNRYLVSHTLEYLPPDFQHVSTWPFLFLIMITIVTFGLSKRRINLSHIFLITGWTAMALYSARNIPLYAVAASPILVGAIGEIIRDLNSHQLTQRVLSFQEGLMEIEETLKGGFWSLMTLLIIGALLLSGYQLDFQKKGNVFLEEIFPVSAVNWMIENPPQGNGFNYFPWGGYLLYRNWPEKLVFIDGQTDFYGEELTRKYERVISVDDGWEGVFHEYHIEWVLMPSESLLIEHLSELEEWQIAYLDPVAVVLVMDK
jgi:hypothetical protein